MRPTHPAECGSESLHLRQSLGDLIERDADVVADQELYR